MTERFGHGPVPMYVQIDTILRDRIQNGDLQPGAPLPSEQELMSIYNVSRTTVRQAMNRLAQDNMIVRVQGKGTFAAQPTVKQELVSLRTLNEVLTSVGLVPEVRVLELNMQPDVSLYVQHRLQTAADEQCVRIKRQHLVEGRPLAFAVIYLSGKFQWRFTPDDLTRQSIYAWLEEHEHVSVDRGVQIITASAADDEVALALDLQPGVPVLCVENTALTATGIPIDHTRFYFPPDRYALAVTLRRTHSGVSLEGFKVDLPGAADYLPSNGTPYSQE